MVNGCLFPAKASERLVRRRLSAVLHVKNTPIHLQMEPTCILDMQTRKHLDPFQKRHSKNNLLPKTPKTLCFFTKQQGPRHKRFCFRLPGCCQRLGRLLPSSGLISGFPRHSVPKSVGPKMSSIFWKILFFCDISQPFEISETSKESKASQALTGFSKRGFLHGQRHCTLAVLGPRCNIRCRQQLGQAAKVSGRFRGVGVLNMPGLEAHGLKMSHVSKLNLVLFASIFQTPKTIPSCSSALA